ncbi:MAG: Tat pathway signal protein [Gemmatimonadetes bacterium]|nr:Tat pathway signal protein [Gemmatimonadota bacterium]
MLSAVGSVALLDHDAFGQLPAPTGGAGYGVDPKLLKSYKPGDLWPLAMNATQRRTAAVLCDVIIPAESVTPSASALHVHDFIDEWISAPYPTHQRDRVVIVDGLAWMDEESARRFGKPFHTIAMRQRHAICDDICYEPQAKAEFKKAAAFFRRYRDLTAGGFYTTPAGMKDIGYVGNVALPAFTGPPKEVKAKLGLGD